MSTTFRGKHILSVDQFDHHDIDLLFAVAARMRPYAQRLKVSRVLEGCVLGNLFFEPSTRSRISFGAAFARLGGTVCDTTGFQFSSMAKGESLSDTSRVVSGYVDIFVVRHPVEGSVGEFAAATKIPVISGGDGPGEHPTQALLDLYTIYEERGRNLNQIDGLRIAMVGDLRYGRTVHSLSKLLCLFKNVRFSFISPNELRMPEPIVDRCRSAGHEVHETEELFSGISDADVIYVTRVQQERFTNEEEAGRFRGSFVINRTVYDKYCKSGAILMHPLPRDSRAGAQELSTDLDTTPNLAIFRQTDNGIPIRMALFALVMGVESDIKDGGKVRWFVPRDFFAH
jgi:aspartate carbamoyltransferase catalytic subunit